VNKTIRTLTLSLLIFLACLPLARSQVVADERSKEFFSGKEPIPTLKLEVDKNNLEMLQKDPKKYIRVNIRNGNTTYRDAGLHLKGAAGSFRGWDDKPAITINSNKFDKKLSFNGLDKFHLNNSVQDQSYFNELIISDMCASAGVPAPRCAHVMVELNNRKAGMYLLKEGFDSVFLRRHFKDASGNLYDGGFLRDIDQDLELDSGTPCDHKDLKELVKACREQDPKKRLAEMDKVLDLDKFYMLWAIEVIGTDWDGYTRNRNNYRIYKDPTTKKFVFFAHGKDQMFGNPQEGIDHQWGGLCARKLFETEEGKKRYYSAIKTAFEKHFDVKKLKERIDTLLPRMVTALEPVNKQWANDIKEQAKGEKQRIQDRYDFLKKEVAKIK
jgi:spore coat protein H